MTNLAMAAFVNDTRVVFTTAPDFSIKIIPLTKSVMGISSSEASSSFHQSFSVLCQPSFLAGFVLAALFLTQATTYIQFWMAPKTSTPLVPYTIPFVAHAIGMAISPYKHFTSTFDRFGWQRPLEMRAGTMKFVAVGNPKLISAAFKASSRLSNIPASLLSLKWLLASPSDVIPFYEADDSGMAASPRKGSQVRQEDRINFHQHASAHKYLSGQSLLALSDQYTKTLSRNLERLNPKNGDWITYPDLYAFLQEHVSSAAIESLMGSEILRLNPDIVQDLWTFDANVPKFLKHLPEWMIPGAYKSRRKLLSSIKKWHAHAHQNSDCNKIGPQDPEWEPYFGSKLIRARQAYSLKMKPMSADARASEDMGLMFASNANILPAIFWFMFHSLTDPKLESRVISELKSTITTPGEQDFKLSESPANLNITELSKRPLLQSIYAEVLRLYNAIAFTRVSEDKDFNLGAHMVKAGTPIVLLSRPSAMNEEVWAEAGRATTVPLSKFQAERFLVASAPQNQEPASRSSREDLSFSLDKLAGIWTPFGGGHWLCPGRHFAKNEILATVALLYSRYEMQILDNHVQDVQPDMWWFPVGGLPPNKKVPFKIRSRNSHL